MQCTWAHSDSSDWRVMLVQTQGPTSAGSQAAPAKELATQPYCSGQSLQAEGAARQVTWKCRRGRRESEDVEDVEARTWKTWKRGRGSEDVEAKRGRGSGSPRLGARHARWYPVMAENLTCGAPQPESAPGLLQPLGARGRSRNGAARIRTRLRYLSHQTDLNENSQSTVYSLQYGTD
ncbi:hypothetical protein NKR23_g12543 [Pleurostoma richardsiae]|uniref:Uncharacterized protein n=1 Tax=Pleurostoma richardsiae TaxID=41990 RepID=A0AA38R7D6_9PEZI|nr:hypothetical protein NKR23_g12543 [Pleurostoma richardsiae]